MSPWKMGAGTMVLVAALVVSACKAEERKEPAPGAGSAEAAAERELEAETAARVRGEEPREAKQDTEGEAGAAKAPPSLGAPTRSPKELFPGEGGLYGVLRTSLGTLVVRLFEEDTPVTVANFAGLAAGKVPYRDPRTGEITRGPYYDGTLFHRVIPRFMIQGGDPTGTGRAGPGYVFRDEKFSNRFDAPGKLAMANSGPNTNGSQFFITEAPTPHLDPPTRHHTIFGEVVSGGELVGKIARVAKGPGDRPAEPVVLEKVEIVRSKEPPKP